MPQQISSGYQIAKSTREKNMGKELNASQALTNRNIISQGNKLTGGSATPAIYAKQNAANDARQAAIRNKYSQYSKLSR